MEFIWKTSKHHEHAYSQILFIFGSKDVIRDKCLREIEVNAVCAYARGHD